MKFQPGIKLSAAALLASFVVFAPARAAIQQTPTQDTPTQVQDTTIVVIPSTDVHEAEEQLQRDAAQAAHEAAEEQERAAKAAHEAEEQLQRDAAHAAHEATEEQERAAEAAAKAAHEAQEQLERAAKDAANAVHEAEEERQRAIAKAAHESEEQLQRAEQIAEKDLKHQAASEVTVVGCVIREREYRKVHRDGKGGAFGMGIGGGNEYILVGATTANNAMVQAGQPCDPTVGGKAYELTGKGESSKLRPYLGHWVELTGKLKKAEITKATRGTADPQPTGGKGPFWQDLKIFEINVYAVKDYVPPVVAVMMPKIEERAAVVETPQPEVAETPAEPAAVATAGRETLPKTASSMPLVALLGAFFVAAAIAIRAIRGMTGRSDM
jgi:chemotaxis protein histidine kinase CheA